MTTKAQFRMVSNGTPSWTTVDDSTYTASVNFSADLTGYSYLATGIQVGDRMFDALGKTYTVDSIANATFSAADLWVVEYGTTDAAPSSQVLVYSPTALITNQVPEVPFGSTGATAQLQAAITTNNAKFGDGAGGTSLIDSLPVASVTIDAAGNQFTIDTAQIIRLRSTNGTTVTSELLIPAFTTLPASLTQIQGPDTAQFNAKANTGIELYSTQPIGIDAAEMAFQRATGLISATDLTINAISGITIAADRYSNQGPEDFNDDFSAGTSPWTGGAVYDATNQDLGIMRDSGEVSRNFTASTTGLYVIELTMGKEGTVTVRAGTENASSFYGRAGETVEYLASLTAGSNNVHLSANFIGASDTVRISQARAFPIDALQASVTLGTADFYDSGNNFTLGDGFIDGNDNFVIGRRALQKVTTGQGNFAMGQGALANLTTGQFNVAIGALASHKLTSASEYVAIGYQASYHNQSQDEGVAIGYQALFGVPGMTGNDNVAIGSRALYAVTTGDDNVAVGFEAGRDLTTGRRNVLIGLDAGEAITGGDDNVLIGQFAGPNIGEGSGNVVVGSGSLSASSPTDIDNNTVVGYSSLSNAQGRRNVAIGAFVGGFNYRIGDDNLLIGYQAGVFDLDTNFNLILIGTRTELLPNAGKDSMMNIGNLLYGINNAAGDTPHPNAKVGILNNDPTYDVDASGTFRAIDPTNNTAITLDPARIQLDGINGTSITANLDLNPGTETRIEYHSGVTNYGAITIKNDYRHYVQGNQGAGAYEYILAGEAPNSATDSLARAMVWGIAGEATFNLVNDHTFRTVSATGNILPQDDILEVSTTSDTLYLPPPSVGLIGKRYYIYNGGGHGASDTTFIRVRDNTSTIELAAEELMIGTWTSRHFVTNGSQWVILSANDK